MEELLSGLRAAAGDDPSTLDKVLKAGDGIPVVEVAATLAGIAVGTYADVKGGDSVGSALAGETVSNTAGAVAATATAGAVGAEIGSELGAAGGPVGIAVGAVVALGAGAVDHPVGPVRPQRGLAPAPPSVGHPADLGAQTEQPAGGGVEREGQL